MSKELHDIQMAQIPSGGGVCSGEEDNEMLVHVWDRKPTKIIEDYAHILLSLFSTQAFFFFYFYTLSVGLCFRDIFLF